MTSGLAELERYEVKRALGAGGLGVVYEALDRETGAIVAIKTLHDVTPDALYRLKREFRLLQGIEHPNVCQHYELFEHAGRWFISMECVRGEHILRAVRDAHGDFDEARLRDSLTQLAKALGALHEAGLVHRDLKPSNVLVEPTGRVVLLDFGFVVESASDATQRSQSIVGTPHYMAPEQALAGEVGPPADWFSFGVILYEALTRKLPHDGDTALAIMLAKQHNDPPLASSISSDVPADLDALCSELLRTEPARRPPGSSVLRRLGGIGGSRESRPVMTTSASIAASFVGRGDELAVLESALRDLERGQPIPVLVEGPSGVGKSTLVQHFSERLADSDALVLAGRCYERESVPYKAFDSAIDALARYLRRLPDVEVAGLLPRHPDLLVRMFPVLGAVPAMTAGPATRAVVGDPHEQRNQAFAALREVLFRIAQRRALVITIDDWQWADADSVVLARDLIRHRESPPLLLVLTARPADDAEATARIDAITTPTLRHVRLASLIPEQAIELVGQLARSFAPSLDLDRAAIARETQGHPLYISELVRYAATRGIGRDASSDQPIRLDEAILARIKELPAEARSIVAALAVAGEPLPLDVVRDVVDLEPAVVQRQTAMLRVAHLVRGGRADGALEPYHDRVREAVLEGMEEEERISWHRRLVYAIEASPLARTRPELLLRHLDVVGESARAVDVAVAAAQRAVQAGAFDQAAGLFALALRGGQLDDQRARALRIEMAKALANAGRGHEAAKEFLAVAAEADRATRLDCHRQAAEELLMIGDIERGLRSARQVLADVGMKMPASQRRALVSVFERAKLGLRGLQWKERPSDRDCTRDVAAARRPQGGEPRPRARRQHSSGRLQRAPAVARSTHQRTHASARSRSQARACIQARRVAGVSFARSLLETVRKIEAESHDARLRAFILDVGRRRRILGMPSRARRTALLRGSEAHLPRRDRYQPRAQEQPDVPRVHVATSRLDSAIARPSQAVHRGSGTARRSLRRDIDESLLQRAVTRR